MSDNIQPPNQEPTKEPSNSLTQENIQELINKALEGQSKAFEDKFKSFEEIKKENESLKIDKKKNEISQILGEKNLSKNLLEVLDLNEDDETIQAKITTIENIINMAIVEDRKKYYENNNPQPGGTGAGDYADKQISRTLSDFERLLRNSK